MPSEFPTVLRLCLLLAGLVVALRGQTLPAPEPERDLSLPIKVGVSETAYPYSYRDSDGNIKGFSVDLMSAVARTMGLTLERVPVTNFNAPEWLRSGQIDMLQSWSETAARRPYTSFSSPYLRAETVIVVHKDTTDIRSADDLNGRRVAIGQKGNVGDNFLTERAPRAVKLYRETNTEFLTLLNRGECDAAVLSRLTVASIIKRDSLSNLRILDTKLQGHDVRYCFAVRKGDDLLLARLNEGLAILNRTGEYETIYHRWFGHTERSSISPIQLVSLVAGVLALASLLAFIAFLRQRTLSHHIALQAEELTRQRALLAALHDNHPLATLILDLPPGQPPHILSLNAQAALLFTLDPAVSCGVELPHLRLTQDTQAFLDAVLARWRNEPNPPRWEFQLPESKRWFEIFLVSLGPDARGIGRLCILAGDISARRAMDHEIALSRRQRALGELVGGVAHEFNNLLTPIIATTSQLNEERRDDPALASDLNTIEEAARRGAELTRRLLTFGRKGNEKAAPVRLQEATQNAIELLRHTIDRRIVLHCEQAGELPPLLFNRTDLHQIIFNLLINARDTLNEKLAKGPAADWQPAIDICFGEYPAETFPLRSPSRRRALLGWQTVSVRDNGMGIPPEIIERVFEPFFTTKEVGTGTGLGLATTWHIVNEAGGHIEIDSRVGEYTRFRVTFPRWSPGQSEAPVPPQGNAPAPAEAGAPAPAPSTPKPDPTPQRRRVLLAEDEDAVARVVQRLLERAGHEVIRCRDGQEAWETLSAPGATPRDVLVLDMNMPRLNGLDLIRRIRDANTPGRIIVMSGRVGETESEELRRLGVLTILGKPVAASTLREAVAA